MVLQEQNRIKGIKTCLSAKDIFSCGKKINYMMGYEKEL